MDMDIEQTESIPSLQQLRKLPVEKLPDICHLIRKKIINRLSTNPGHFASSMGAVEIAVALHYVFDTPVDHIVWDVGHQAYAHKLLTGREVAFSTLRTMGGISGFPSPMESEYDSFVAGHAGNSISAALGMAIADLNTPGAENHKTVAVIGDASIGCGLAFEGLNNASNNRNNLLIILNDNDMSIDDNVGALHRYLSDISTSKRYNKVRDKLYRALKRKGIVSETGRGRLLRFNNSVKALVSGNQNIFEGLNIRYFGPFDGHDVIKLVRTLQEIKEMKGPRLLHLKTVKGKGFAPAESNPAVWHAPGKFDPATGERQTSQNPDLPKIPNWQNVFGNTLVELADENPEVVAITAAMPSGTSVAEMLKKYPQRTFDVGISEGHAVTFAGGLAAEGKHPFVAIYSSFLQRGYDNIIHDVAIQGLPVTFCIDRAGIVGEDGVTHHGLFDIAYLRIIPGLAVASPMDEETLRNLMFTGLKMNSPLAIRYPRGKAFKADWKSPMSQIEIGKGRTISSCEDSKIAVLTIGPIGHKVHEIVGEMMAKGIKISHYDMIWVKPLDMELLRQVATNHRHIITVEDGISSGGFGSAVLETLNEEGITVPVTRLGVPDRWVNHGTVEQLFHSCGYDKEGMANTIERIHKELDK